MEADFITFTDQNIGSYRTGKIIQNGGRTARLLQYSTHNTISMYHPYSAVPLRGKCHCRNLWILYCTGTGVCINMISTLF